MFWFEEDGLRACGVLPSTAEAVEGGRALEGEAEGRMAIGSSSPLSEAICFLACSLLVSFALEANDSLA